MTEKCERCQRKEGAVVPRSAWPSRITLCRRRICQLCAWDEYLATTILAGADVDRVRAVFMGTWDRAAAARAAMRAAR